jgi:hypothetical protein
MLSSFINNIKEKSDIELKKIFLDSHNYQSEFISMVKNELENRKIADFEDLNIQKAKDEKKIIEEMEYGKEGNITWIAIYFISIFLGGIVGVFAGYYYAFSERENSNGEKYYTFNKETRNYGKAMFYIGLIVFLGTIYFNLKKMK